MTTVDRVQRETDEFLNFSQPFEKIVHSFPIKLHLPIFRIFKKKFKEKFKKKIEKESHRSLVHWLIRGPIFVLEVFGLVVEGRPGNVAARLHQNLRTTVRPQVVVVDRLAWVR